MSQTLLNHALLTLSILLEATLILRLYVVRLYRAHRARTITLLPWLLGFAVIRSLLLFALPRHLHADDYVTLYGTLSILGILLEIAIAFELAWRTHQASTRRPREMFALVAFAWCFTLLIAYSLPASPFPVDRLELFAALLFTVLGAYVYHQRKWDFCARVTAGLAIFGAADLISIIGKANAAAHHDAHLYTQFSYLVSGTWLALLCFWQIALLQASASTLEPS